MEQEEKRPYPFVVGERYKKAEIYQVCRVPEKRQKGNWNTGYHNYEGDWFIFCNVGVAGRTGHDYANRFVGENLHWYGKTTSSKNQPAIQSMLHPEGFIYLFHREADREPFTFAGLASAQSWADEVPFQITWRFLNPGVSSFETLPEEVPDSTSYREGATKQITVNAYERNTQARTKCIDHHGLNCVVCTFNFADRFGALGDGYIHVHHLKPISTLGEEYELDPVKDLRPVCPNCHAMLHRTNPPKSIDELKKLREHHRSQNSEDNS